jgi:hypothetical protein
MVGEPIGAATGFAFGAAVGAAVGGFGFIKQGEEKSASWTAEAEQREEKRVRLLAEAAARREQLANKGSASGNVNKNKADNRKGRGEKYGRSDFSRMQGEFGARKFIKP